jgi:hypothetical protein
MPPRKKSFGVGAVVSCLSKFIHPSEHIRKAYPNPVERHRLEDCIVVRQEAKKVGQKTQLCLVVTHNDFKDDNGVLIELHAVKNNWKLKQEGDPDLFFDAVAGHAPFDQTVEEQPFPDEILDKGNGYTEENLIEALTDIVEIDDDNQPLPENVPNPQDNENNILSDEWGHDGLCSRRQSGSDYTLAKLSFHVDPTEDDLFLQLFEGLFPKTYVETILIPETNKKMGRDPPVTYGEFLRWVGLWVIMSTVDGSERRSFWATTTPNIFKGAPFRLQQYMSRNRFEAILSAITYTNEKPPQYKDRFWEVRQLINEWNANMNAHFVPSWINAIDESMSKWINQFTCPGFMYVPRKPWPFGNEYHDAGCCQSDVIWQVDLREGKDRPAQAGPKEYDNIGKTTGTLMRLTKPIHGTGKVFVLDSGFCVLEALIKLRNVGIFAHALVKKR